MNIYACNEASLYRNVEERENNISSFFSFLRNTWEKIDWSFNSLLGKFQG
jgi:hypothetical protein